MLFSELKSWRSAVIAWVDLPEPVGPEKTTRPRWQLCLSDTTTMEGSETPAKDEDCWIGILVRIGGGLLKQVGSLIGFHAKDFALWLGLFNL